MSEQHPPRQNTLPPVPAPNGATNVPPLPHGVLTDLSTTTHYVEDNGASSSSGPNPYDTACDPPGYKQSFPSESATPGCALLAPSSTGPTAGSVGEKGKGKRGKCNLVCWNCQARGHLATQCKKPKKNSSCGAAPRATTSAKAIAKSVQETQEKHDGELDALREINAALREEVRDVHAENARLVNTTPRTIANFEVKIGADQECYPAFMRIYEESGVGPSWLQRATLASATFVAATTTAALQMRVRTHERDMPVLRTASAAATLLGSAVMVWDTFLSPEEDEAIYINVSSEPYGQDADHVLQDERVAEMRHGDIDVDASLRRFRVIHSHKGRVFAQDDFVASAALVNACEESLGRNRSYADALPAALHRVAATCSVNSGFLSQNEGPIRQNSAHIAALRFMRGQSTTANIAMRYLKA